MVGSGLTWSGLVWSGLVWTGLVTIDELSIFKGQSDVAASPTLQPNYDHTTTLFGNNNANIEPIQFFVELLEIGKSGDWQ